MENGGYKSVYERVDPDTYSVRWLSWMGPSIRPRAEAPKISPVSLIASFDFFIVRRLRMEPPSWALKWR